MRKKIFAMGLCFMMAAAAVTGCSSGKKETEKATEAKTEAKAETTAATEADVSDVVIEDASEAAASVLEEASEVVADAVETALEETSEAAEGIQEEMSELFAAAEEMLSEADVVLEEESEALESALEEAPEVIAEAETGIAITDETEMAAVAVNPADFEFTTINEGVLTVGTSPDFAPYEFYHIDENGTPQMAGFDIALSQRIADDLGLELQIVPMDFDGILMELQNSNIDLGVSGFSPTPERAETFDFSDLYYMGGQAFCVRTEDKDKFAGYEDFKGLPVGAQTGSIQYGLAQENTSDANIIGLAKVTDIVSELISGKLEGAFIEKDVAIQYAKNYPELCVLWDVPYDSEGSAIAVKKGNEGLVDAVNAVIAASIADGSMADYIAEAQDLASDEGNVYEGQLDENGEVAAEETTEAATE